MPEMPPDAPPEAPAAPARGSVEVYGEKIGQTLARLLPEGMVFVVLLVDTVAEVTSATSNMDPSAQAPIVDKYRAFLKSATKATDDATRH